MTSELNNWLMTTIKKGQAFRVTERYTLVPVTAYNDTENELSSAILVHENTSEFGDGDVLIFDSDFSSVSDADVAATLIYDFNVPAALSDDGLYHFD